MHLSRKRQLSEAAILDRTCAGAPHDYSSAHHLRAHTRAGFDVHASLRAMRRNPRGATLHNDPSVMFLRLKAGYRLTEKPQTCGSKHFQIKINDNTSMIFFFTLYSTNIVHQLRCLSMLPF